MEKVDLMGTKPKDFEQKTLKKGAKVETEHTTSDKESKKIAMQHMAEFPKKGKEGKVDSDYYEELDQLEGDLKKKQNYTFEDLVRSLLKKENCTVSGVGGVFGDSPEIGGHGGDVGNSDWYATGDGRNMFGAVQGGKNSRKGKKPMRRKLQRRI